MTKKIWIFTGIGAVIILFLMSLLLANNQPAQNQQSGPSKGSASRSPLTIPTSKGDVIINDITKHPVQQVPDNVVIDRTNQFTIVYYPNEKTFSINVLANPLQQSRSAAEAALLKDLGIDQGQACKLTVTTFVPFDVDQNASGRDYGLSFCPSGQPL